MAAPKLRFYDSGDVAEASTLTFAPTAGTPTAAQELHLWNDEDGTAGSDTATEVRITALARTQGDTNYTQNDEVLTSGWLEVRAIGANGTGISVQTTSWQRIGNGRYLYLLDIPAECNRELEFRLNVPASAGSVTKEIKIRAVASKLSVTLSEGFMESGAQGVYSGLGDELFSGILQGGVVTATGTPDDDINIANLIWIHKGIGYCKLAHAVTLNGDDGSSVALSSGESYWATISCGASGTLTVTKSDLGTSPLAANLREPVPDGEVLLCYVEREFDATIEQGDIYEEDRIYYRFAYADDGLDVTIYPGIAIVGDEKVSLSRPSTITLADDDDSYVWLNPDGTLTAELAGVPPQDHSLLLWLFTAASGSVTVAVDRRTYIGRRLHVVQMFIPGTLSVSDKAYGMFPSMSRGRIRPVNGVTFGVSATGTTSGATTATISKAEQGATSFTSLFTSSGSNDQRPSVAYNATSLVDFDALPEVLEVGPMAMFELNIAAIPGGSDSANAVACVLVEEV